MNTFIQTYSSKSSIQLRSIPAGSFLAGGDHVFVAGAMDQAPWFGKFDSDGNPVWQKRYVLDSQPAGFHRATRCDNGDFILYGSRVPNPKALPTATRNHHLVIRVDADGDVRWARTYHGEHTRYNVDMIKSPNDTYIFASWYNQGSSVDDVELVKIDGSGEILHTVRILTRQDDQVSGLIPWKDGCVVYGNSNAGPNWDCFFAGFDGELEIQFSRLMGDKSYQTLNALIEVDGLGLVATGETGKERISYIAQLDPSSATVAAHAYDFKKYEEQGHKLLRRGPGGGFYLVAEMPSKPRLSFVARFDKKFHINWMRRFNLDGDHILYDLQYSNYRGKEQLAICGVAPAQIRLSSGLLASTDINMNSCVTQDLPVPQPKTIQFALKPWKVKVEAHKVEMVKWKPDAQRVEVGAKGMCKQGPSVTTAGTAKFQSPYIYLQTVGSTHADDSVSGFHLRWELMRSLGEQHLPKGNLAAPGGPYATNIAFNRADDFVRIYKTDFRSEFGITIDFAKPPSALVESGPTRDWLILGLSSTSGLTTDVLLRFTNKALYNYLRVSIDPMVNPMLFLSQYTAPIELRTSGKLFFYLDINLVPTGGGSGYMRLETISLPDPLDPNTRQISSRRKLVPSGATGLVGENWEYLRFDIDGVVPLMIYLIPYEDYITGVSARNGWNFFNEYALDDGLSDANAQVFARLEDTSIFNIDRDWRKFNEPTSGEFRVNVNNYQNRWMMGEGLRDAVITYLDKSQVDPLANVELLNQDPQTSDSSTEVSYLLLLNMAGLDFHVGRMLGFGAIDPAPNQPAQYPTVYLMQYDTSAALESEPAQFVRHFYMAPPISIYDHRLPPEPELLPIVYGLAADQCGGTTALTDANGYAQFADVRFINLHRKQFRFEKPWEPFFIEDKEFDLFLNTQPVLYGVEYAAGAIGTGSWVRPEISHDIAWLDPGGLPEVRPIPETGENPVYTHGETNPGIHHYAMYSINWFSRVSQQSNEVQTDPTQFDPRNTMLPPSNFMVQLIQKEVPLVLTSYDEQVMLSSMGGGDKTLVRAIFEWNQVQNKAYQSADKAQLFFRVDPPKFIKGKVTVVSVNTFLHTADLSTGPYTQSSQPSTVQPFVNAADTGRFIGASMVIDGEPFIVEAILSSGNNPLIRVKQVRQTGSVDSLNNNEFCTTETFISPEINKTFLLVENLDNATSWDTQLNKEVTITQFLPVHTELEVHPDGQTTTHFIGGLTGAATINHVYDTDPGLAPFIPPGGPPANQVPTGIYTVAFTTALMAPHPESDVSYHGGSIRLETATGVIRDLLVWNIDLSGTHPVVTVYDPSFALQRDAAGMFILTAGQFTPEVGLDPILTGGVAFANFHPGYRVYLRTDLGGGHNFGEASILPGLDEGTRQSFMSIRAVDSSIPLQSYMGFPAILLAREIREPVPPGVPLGNVYATRPNFYGKATYTFDTRVTQPFSLIFFRANERRILDQLYHPEKVREILDTLAALPEADAIFEQNRWSDLVNMVTDGGGEFKEYVPDGFRFPPPTNPNYVVPDPSLTTPVMPFSIGNTVPPGSSAIVAGTGRSWAQIVRQAIEGAFVPMTEIPPVYSQIRNTTIQTSGKPPKVRDANGNRLPPTHAEYDPWPMVVRFERNAQDQVLVSGNTGYGNAANRRFVRFTDYTLDGASKNTYFYFSKELSNTMQVSGASPVVGPVKLVNAAPAEAPGIGRVTTLVQNSTLSTKDGVAFELNEYLPTEGIRDVELYRATDPDDALSIRTMKLVKTVAAGTEMNDTFDDVSFIPYGEPLFYRIVALRAIKNERGLEELIPSKPSNLVMASLIDNANPPAPKLAFSSDPPIGSPIMLHNVVLSWEPTCYNGHYILYKRGSGGHWMKIAEQDGNGPVFYQALATSDLANGTLAKQDDDLNYVFHHFKVVAMNSSGLLSLDESVLRI